MRLAEVLSPKADQVRDYLPANYQVICTTDDDRVIIAGEDDHGWTLDDYVIPRLGSGLMFAREIKLEQQT